MSEQWILLSPAEKKSVKCSSKSSSTKESCFRQILLRTKCAEEKRIIGETTVYNRREVRWHNEENQKVTAEKEKDCIRTSPTSVFFEGILPYSVEQSIRVCCNRKMKSWRWGKLNCAKVLLSFWWHHFNGTTASEERKHAHLTVALTNMTATRKMSLFTYLYRKRAALSMWIQFYKTMEMKVAIFQKAFHRNLSTSETLTEIIDEMKHAKEKHSSTWCQERLQHCQVINTHSANGKCVSNKLKLPELIQKLSDEG